MCDETHHVRASLDDSGALNLHVCICNRHWPCILAHVAILIHSTGCMLAMHAGAGAGADENTNVHSCWESCAGPVFENAHVMKAVMEKHTIVLQLAILDRLFSRPL